MMRITIKALAVGLFSSVLAANASAQTSANQVLVRQPVQSGVLVSNPSPADLPSCKVEEMVWTGGAKGVVVTDGTGKKLRQFIDTKGGKSYNIYSYFTDGVESYREIDSTGAGKPDQFRWLGINGTKWGIDRNGDSVVDEWYIISPEEAAQEVFAAVQSKNANRLSALMVKETDLKALNVPAGEITTIMNKAGAASGKLTGAIQAMQLNEKAKMVHAQFTAPFTRAADTFGGKDDLVTHKNGTVLFDKGDGKAMDVMHLGELVQIGRAWKVVEGPSYGAVATNDDPNGLRIPATIEAFVKELTPIAPPKNQADYPRYHLQRAAILEKCVAGTTGVQQTPWLKQLIDSYLGAIEADHTQKAAMTRLTEWKDVILKTPNADEMQAYVGFRHMAAEFAVKSKEAKGPDVLKVQVAYHAELEKFVKTYAKSSDTPDAMMRLAMANEYNEKDGVTVAKNWYDRISKEFPAHPLAAKSAGAVRRLTSEGQQFILAGTGFDGKPFSVTSLGGKPAVVIFWASWATGAADELKNIADLNRNYAAKGLQVVTCCIDDDANKEAARAMLRTANLNDGFHLHAAGGTDQSPLATVYGIQVVPHVMLVDKDGKVASRNAQTGPQLKEEVEKLMK